MDDQSKLRKYENLLAISGAGVIAFGLWSVVKAVIYLIAVSPGSLLARFDAEGLASLENSGISATGISVILVSVILLVLLADISIRFYVGRSAIVDGRRQKRKSIVYVIMAIFLAAGLVSSTVNRFVPSEWKETSAWDDMMNSMDASIFIDLTSLLAFIEMIVAAIMVRRLRKSLGAENLSDEGTEVM